MKKKQIRLAFDEKYKPLADDICETLALNSYSQLFAYLLKLHGTKLQQLMEKN